LRVALLTPILDILPAPQRRLWSELAAVPDYFIAPRPSRVGGFRFLLERVVRPRFPGVSIAASAQRRTNSGRFDDIAGLPVELRKLLTDAVAATDPNMLPKLSPYRQRPDSEGAKP
jgi:hypothetical protein